jgi:hypothetical protein
MYHEDYGYSEDVRSPAFEPDPPEDDDTRDYPPEEDEDDFDDGF